MKISIKSSVGNGRIHDFDIESSITIQELKQRLRETTGDYNFQTMGLIFDGELLDNDDTVSDFDIKAGSVLELINTTNYRSLRGFVGLKFVDVSVSQGLQRIQWSQTAPRWRRARHGLCLEGQCTNSKCEAHGCTVIIPMSYRKFDMSVDPNETTTKCPACKKYVNPINCGFNNCWWRYDGTKDCENGPPQSCSSEWTRADDAYHRFDEQESGIITWRKLTFEVAKQRPSETPVGAPNDSVELEKSESASEESARSEAPQSSATLTPSPSSAAAAAAIPPKQSRHLLNRDEVDVNWSAQPDIFWCPWNSKSCTNKLIITGQGTVEIMQNTSIPFELRLSNSDNPHDDSAYAIILSVDRNHVKLSTSKGQSYESTESLHSLQPDDGSWHRYWISFYGKKGNVKYGVGEIRPLFAVFNVNLPENEAQLAEQIHHLCVKLDNDDEMLTKLDDLKEKFRFYIGKKPILYDPPLFIVPNDLYLSEHAIDHTAVPPSQLEKPCRDLYDSIINFKLNDDDFPDLTSVIEKSIKNSNGWCHRKLTEKSTRFGKSNFKATYLRLTLGDREGNAPGHTFVVEVWPRGHFSPIHNHSNTYAIIRVLYGEILLKLYPALRLNVNQYQPIEQICHEGQITWLLPNLNQTHQLKHVDLYGKCCITIQCYAYGIEDRQHYEYFDYLANDGQSIGHFDPKSDMDFYKFKDLMRQEQRQIFHSSS